MRLQGLTPGKLWSELSGFLIFSWPSIGWWRTFKGTVRPDWIWMRVVPLDSPLKGHQPLRVFDFLISVLNIWNNFKVLSRFMQNWTQTPSCSDHGLHKILSSYWLAHCYLIKKSTKVALYLGVDCGMMDTSRNPKNNWCLSRIYGIPFGEKDHGLSTCKPWSEQAGGLGSILHEAAQDFELF